MKRGMVKNYPRRKVWVILARNKETGRLAILGPSERFTIVKEGMVTPIKWFYNTDSVIRNNLPIKFTKTAYRDMEQHILKRVDKALERTKLSESWEIFVSRLGSDNCPIELAEEFNYNRNTPIKLTLKEKK